MLQTVRAEKVDEKMGSFVRFPCFLSELWSLNCPNKCIFCNFVLTSARKSKSDKAIYIYGSESSYYNLSENDMVYRGLSHRSNIDTEVIGTVFIIIFFMKNILSI